MVDIANSTIRVGEQLSGAGTYVNNIATQLTQELDALRTKLQPLQDAWQSQAGTMYQDDMALWNMGAAALFGSSEGTYQAGQGLLGVIAQLLDGNNHNYVDAELANRKTWTPSP